MEVQFAGLNDPRAKPVGVLLPCGFNQAGLIKGKGLDKGLSLVSRLRVAPPHKNGTLGA